MEIDYPESLDRLTTFFRLIWVIPTLIILGFLTATGNETVLTRVGAYLVLITDQYPSTEDEQSVHLELDYPDVEQDLNRWLSLVKWFLAIPHYLVLVVLAIGAVVAVAISWFASSSPAAIHAYCSITSWASPDGLCGSRRTRSSWSQTNTHHSDSTDLTDVNEIRC